MQNLLKLERITAENIFSYKNIDVDVSSFSSCLITGENGTGKTSLINIPRLVFFKKSEKKNILLNGKGKGKASVVVGGNLVERVFPGNKVTLNEKEISQEELEDFLGVNDKIFCSSVYYLQEQLNAFAASTPAKQMEMFSDMLPDLSLIDRIRMAIKVDYDQCSEALEESNIKIREWRSQLENTEGWLDDIDGYERKEKKEQKKLNDAKQEYEGTEKQLIDIRAKLQTAILNKKKVLEINNNKKELKECKDELLKFDDGLDERYSKYNEKYNNAAAEKLGVERDMAVYKRVLKIGGECPTCFQEIDEKHIQKFRKALSGLEEKESQLISTMEKNKKNLSIVEKQIQKKNYIESKIKNLISTISIYEKDVSETESASELEEKEKQYTEKFISIKNQYEEIKNNIQKFAVEKQRLVEKLERQKHIKKKIKQIREEVAKEEGVFDLSHYWIKQLPVIKIKMIEDNVNLMEAVMNGCMEELYPSFNVRINTETQLKSGDMRDKLSFQIVSDTGKIREWDDLSGGEKARIALGAQIAISEIVNHRIGFEIYDEIFDGMDDSGIEATINLIQRRARDKQIFMISHNKEIGSSFESIIEVGKHGGHSCLI